MVAVVVVFAGTVMGNDSGVSVKSDTLRPLNVAFESTRSAFPLFAITNCSVLVLFTSTDPNASGDGEGLNPGDMPVPVRAIDCGESLAASVNVNVAVLAPNAAGLNDTVKVADAFGRIVLPNVGETLKSEAFAPAMAILVMLRFAVPVLVTTTFWLCAALLTDCVPKSSEVGAALKIGSMPLPDKATVCGLFGAESVICNDADSIPLIEGLNVIGTARLLNGFSVTGSLGMVTLKSPVFAPAKSIAVIVIAPVPLFDSINVVLRLAVFIN